MGDKVQDIAVWILIISLGASVFLLKGYIILGVPGLIILVLSILMIYSNPQPRLTRLIASSLAGWSLLYLACIISLRFSFSGQPGDYDTVFIWTLLNIVGLPLAVGAIIAWHILLVRYRRRKPLFTCWDSAG